jgi:pyruvate,water dikinase
MPNSGVGLARLEFIINNNIGVHPKAILDYPEHRPRPEEGGGVGGARPRLAARLLRRQAGRRHRHHRRGLLAQAGDRAAVGLQEQRVPQADRRQRYEPDEENPMLGFRGASRYISGEFGDAFAMECEALKRVRGDMGLTNVEIMVPFVRTVKQAERVTADAGRARPEARAPTACA